MSCIGVYSFKDVVTCFLYDFIHKFVYASTNMINVFTCLNEGILKGTYNVFNFVSCSIEYCRIIYRMIQTSTPL